MGTIPRLCKYKKIKDFARKSFILSGGQTRNRTRDTRIFSPPLYHLSYLAFENFEVLIRPDFLCFVKLFFKLFCFFYLLIVAAFSFLIPRNPQ